MGGHVTPHSVDFGRSVWESSWTIAARGEQAMHNSGCLLACACSLPKNMLGFNMYKPGIEGYLAIGEDTTTGSLICGLIIFCHSLACL